MLVSEGQEVSMGRESDPAVTAQYGLVDDPELQAYVSRLGMGIAEVSERPQLPWSFKVVDDPIVNAFALPGGFIYVTRGILLHFDSEAELMGVLGHEVGHVTARHGASQMSRQQLQMGLLGAGAIVSEEVRRYGALAVQGLQLLNLSYSRGDESESDRLGLRYISTLGYDADAMIGVFQMLAAVGGGGSGRLPEWQMTHPYPENREADMREEIAATGASRQGTINRDAYLDMIDGMVVGMNPRDGYFEDQRFLHPELAFEMTFPTGWATVNQKTLVGAQPPSEDAVVLLTVAQDVTDPADALAAFMGAEGISGGPGSSSTRGGITMHRSGFQAATEQGTVSGEVAFAQHGSLIYRILGYASPEAWAGHRDVVATAISSFGAVDDPEVLNVEPLRLRIVTLTEATSLGRWVQENPQPLEIDVLTRYNRVDAAEVLSAGTRIKTAVGTPIDGSLRGRKPENGRERCSILTNSPSKRRRPSRMRPARPGAEATPRSTVSISSARY
jgi:predicted Zn-dependent protease